MLVRSRQTVSPAAPFGDPAGVGGENRKFGWTVLEPGEQGASYFTIRSRGRTGGSGFSQSR